MKHFNLQPTPSVLVALTHTAMEPIDALCELVDNAIDSFSNAEDQADQINEIRIDLPTKGQLEAGSGAVRVSDNGPGMTPEEAQNALTAGYSSHNAYDRLGMFGMGLNIATGKFARKTRLITATRSDEQAITAEVDLEALMAQKDFRVQPTQSPKSEHFAGGQSGTIIELTGWWPEPNPNKDFPLELVKRGPGKVQKLLERRYAALLRGQSGRGRFKIFVKENECLPFEHCVWGENRYVTRNGVRVHAQIKFDEILHKQDRCIDCDGVVQNGRCPVDESHIVRNVKERVRGWIGVQRYQDKSEFGIDLIRKGRTIRVFEKEAFFTYTNDVGEKTVDYPIDSPYGRIVGEVHLDHVRVDFTKQNFDRATPEWQRAMEFLRGKSSLQPRMEGAKKNETPVKIIFDAYRRVRKYGVGDMYMGERQPGATEATRVSAETLNDFRKKFLAREPGYFDDAKWWENIENVSYEPEDIDVCPGCETQNPPDAESCGFCGHVLKAKKCNNCGKEIPQSALKCEHCGRPQVEEADGPWACGYCRFTKNPADVDECRNCSRPKGAVNPLDPGVLLANSVLDEDLSEDGVTVPLPDGTNSESFNLETRVAVLRDGNLHLPAVVRVDAAARKLQIFLDKTHTVFQSLQLRPEHAVAAEAAAFIRTGSMAIMSGPRKNEHNLTVLQEKLLEKYWKDRLSDDPEHVRQEMNSLLDEIRAKMADNMADMAEEIFGNMTDDEQTAMVMNMHESHADIASMGEFKKTGRFMLYISPETVISVFRGYPDRFFKDADEESGKKPVWKSLWVIPGISEESVRAEQKRLKETYLNCLEDGVGFLRYKKLPADVRDVVVRRAKMSIEFLQKNIAD